jgi:hypothetical protein
VIHICLACPVFKLSILEASQIGTVVSPAQ